MKDWDFIKHYFFADEDYMEKSMEVLKKEKQAVEELSIKLEEKLSIKLEEILSNKGENPKRKLWEFLIKSQEYEILQKLNTQINDNEIIVYGDYYFEKFFLPARKEIFDNLDRGKYGINASLPPEKTTVNLTDLDRELYLERYRAILIPPDNRISTFDTAREFIKSELNIEYNDEMKREERFDYLKLLKLVHKYSNDLQYLKCPSANRIENDLISTSSTYHEILSPIKREVMKEIEYERLNKLSETFILFNHIETEIEKYTMFKLANFLDLAPKISMEYAVEVLSHKSERLIEKLNNYSSMEPKTIRKKQSIFEKTYMMFLLWISENKFHITDGYIPDSAIVNLNNLQKISYLKRSVNKKLYISDIEEFVKEYAKEIAQLVFGKDDVDGKDINNVKRFESIEKYQVLLQMVFDLGKRSPQLPVTLEEIIAVIQVVKKYTIKNIKISDPAYKGATKSKPKSLKPIVSGMSKRLKTKKECLQMNDHRYLRILKDMVEEQFMVNCGVTVSLEQKLRVRKAVYKTYLKEVGYLVDDVPSERNFEFFEEKAEFLKYKIYLFINTEG